MFRFPRSAEAPQVLELEKRFLAEFASLSPLPVPVYEIQGEGFVGYRKIEGLLLSPQRYSALPAERQKRLAEQIGAFLSALHTFPIQRARQMGMTEGWDGWREKALQTFKAHIAPRLSHRALKGSMACFEALRSQSYPPVVVHGDFYPDEHLFLHPERQELCGIIDFGDLTIEDAACDLKNIRIELGESALRAVLDRYTAPTDDRLLERINLHVQADALYDAADAVLLGYPGRLTQAIRTIERNFAG